VRDIQVRSVSVSRLPELSSRKAQAIKVLCFAFKDFLAARADKAGFQLLAKLIDALGKSDYSPAFDLIIDKSPPLMKSIP
jgi:hypothetical protein